MSSLGQAFPKLGELPRRLSLAGLSIDSSLQDLPSHLRTEVEAFVVEHLFEYSLDPLEVLTPEIRDVADIPIACSVGRGRLYSALSRLGIRTWGNLASWSVSRLRQIPGVGDASVQDILRSLARLLLSEDLQRSRRRWAFVSADLETIHFATETLQLMATWAEREYEPSLTLAELLQQVDGLPLPADLERRLAEIKGTPLRCLSVATLLSASIEELTEELLQSLDDAERRIFELRVLAAPRATLKEAGEELGFTRERARQLQSSAEECISSLLLCRRYLPLHWRASRLRTALGRCAPVDHPSLRAALDSRLWDVTEEHRHLVEGFLLHLAGPYRQRDGWFELEEREPLSPTGLLELADEDGLLSFQEAASWLAEAGIAAAFQDSWISDLAKFRRHGDVLMKWTGSFADKSVAVLALRGTAADVETLVAEVGEGHSVRTAQNACLGDERLIRVNRSEWALRKWNLEEYTGITDEIAQRIWSAGGSASLAQIVEQLVEQFGVRASSVRVYAEAPMFVVEEGRIRLRRDDEPYPIPENLSSCRGVYQWGTDRLSVLVPVDGEVLRGSGRVFPAQAAGVLGVCPGRPRSFSWSDGSLAITWPLTAAFGPSLGSLRAVAASVGARAGDSIRLEFRRSDASVRAELVPDSQLTSIAPRDALHLITGLPSSEEPVKALAAALKVSPSGLRKCLYERGDASVADLLPRPPSDLTLESALSALAESLDDSVYS